MFRNLTTGSINRILGGEEVSGAIMQVLGCKRIPGASDRYRLLVSDGITGCPFAMLGTQLNSLVTNKELEKFTIVRVDKCVCNKIPDERKVMILLNLTVLTPGAEVNEKIGNPINYNSNSAASTSKSTTETKNNNNEPHSVFTAESKSVNIPQMNGSEMNGSTPSVHPIASLTPYQNKWTIKVRVTSKTPIRTWSNSRGEGKLFSVNFLDESGEIRATGFNDSVDKFYDILEVNKVFYVSKAILKTANKNYSTVNNDYEMNFNPDTTITPCEDSSSSIPMLQFDFIPIANIENIEKDTCIDVIGICKSASDIHTFVARTTNKELVKRDVKIVDRSNKEVSLTLWGNEAEKFDGSLNPVVAIKSAKVSDFNGRSLSSTMSSTLQINPDIREAHLLKGWYDREGCNLEVESISSKGGGAAGNTSGQWKTFAQVSSERLGMGDKPDYYVTKATVVMLRKENCMYMACPSEECNKKVVDMNNGMYRCEKCNNEYPEFKWRLLLSISLADFTENQWVTCFQEAAESILGISAQELGSLKETEEDRFNEILADANFKSYIFKLRTKMETYNEESRLKTIVVTAIPVEPVSYAKKVLSDIKQMQKDL